MQYGQQRRRGEHAGIRRDRRKLRSPAAEHEGCRHGSDDPPRQRDRARERHGRQQDPVDQQLPEHAPRASAQREANRDLVAPGQRARQGQARKVGARDRQENPHQGQEHPERGAVPGAQAGIARRERCHVQPLTEQRLPLGFGQRGRQRRRLNRRPSREQFRARRVDGHAAGETSDDVFRSKRPGRVTSGRSHDRERHDDVESPVELKTVETVRRDADHRRRHAVDLDASRRCRDHPRRCAGGNRR